MFGERFQRIIAAMVLVLLNTTPSVEVSRNDQIENPHFFLNGSTLDVRHLGIGPVGRWP